MDQVIKNLENCLRIEQEINLKIRKNHFVPFSHNPMTQYLREDLSGNCYTYMYYCVNRLGRCH